MYALSAFIPLIFTAVLMVVFNRPAKHTLPMPWAAQCCMSWLKDKKNI